MRTHWLETLVITLGLVGFVGCKGDEGKGTSVGDGDSSSDSESGSSTVDGESTTTTTGDGDTDCIPGELGCSCNDGLCLGDLVCENDLCTDPNCLPGELACECNNGECLGDLVCVEGVCLEDGGSTETSSDSSSETTTAETDTGMECPNPNEMVCEGSCVDVVSNPDNCGECGVTCEVSNDMTVGGCVDNQCEPYWSECFLEEDGFTTCEEVCQAEGKVCVEEGCGGYTWVQSGNFICQTGDTNVPNSKVSCGGPIVWQDMYARCCCL